jgi:hypothetical protein
MHQFPKFTPAWNSTCFRQFLCPSSGVYPLYARHGMSYRFEDSFRAGPGWNTVPSWYCLKDVFKPVWHVPVPSVQWINSWWWAEELPEACRVSCWSKFGKLVHLVGFIIKKIKRKFVTSKLILTRLRGLGTQTTVNPDSELATEICFSKQFIQNAESSFKSWQTLRFLKEIFRL